MRAGLSTILQTLTPEAASVLNHSIAEAGRRNHGQTSPLHVAATLLTSPSGYLRQACIRSHPNSSHPLQCRALELCFSVALDRLPAAQGVSSGSEPPISNALMAALKRAQAHQRRGCPEQQQQPLLAVKVELEQLIISILDDPSVSRVMREASFSSPAVKAVIEQALNSTPMNVNPSTIGIGFRPTPSPSPPSSIPILNRHLYLNPRFQVNSNSNLTQLANQRNEEVKNLIEILLRSKKKNPVLVGDSEPDAVIKELLRRIEKGEMDEAPLKNVEVISIEKDLESFKTQIPAKINDLGAVIESRIGNSNGGGVILDLGDLKWLVEQPVIVGVPEMGRAAVAEMGKLLAKVDNGRVWLVGTATCETYLRCQVYHPSMENDWDLQAVPIASRSPLPGMFTRLGNNFPTSVPRCISENLDPAQRTACCPQCSENYEQEIAKLVAEKFEKSSSEVGTETARPPLPPWLQNTKLNIGDAKTADNSQTKGQELILKQKTQELQKKWNDTCLHLHPNYHHNLSSERIVPTSLSLTGMYNQNYLLHQTFQPKLQQTRNLRETLQLNPHRVASQPLHHSSTPLGSPVRTELVLGPMKVTVTTPQKLHEEERVKEFLGCISSEPQTKFDQLLDDKFANALDADSFKKLLKGLMERTWWQSEAASALASTVLQCKLEKGKQRVGGSKGNIWLLFTGPDRVGKMKMASVLSEHIFATSPAIICLGSRRDNEEADLNFRGRTTLDRIVEVVRRNPSSVIVLQDIDEADMQVCGSIKRAMERGRLADSYGREISLGNIIFILTGNWSAVNQKLSISGDAQLLDENRLALVASGGWQLRLIIGEKSAKRRANCVHEEERQARQRKEMGCGLSLNLNLAADAEDDQNDGSHNSSDLTVDHEDEHENRRMSITSVPHELISSVDGAIVFKPVDGNLIRREIGKTITKTFSAIVGDKLCIEVEEAALEKIHGGVWLGRMSLQEWAERVLSPTFHRLRSSLSLAVLGAYYKTPVVRLEPDTDSDAKSGGDWLPTKIRVMVDME